MFINSLKAIAWAGVIFMLSACVGVNRLEVEGTFPIPLMEKTPVSLGIHLDDDILSYVHKETIEKGGEWEVSIGPAQQNLFNNLAAGVFEGYAFVESTSISVASMPLDGVLKPSIREVQFSLPKQTRSDYYEVWIRYEFQLYDRAGTLVGEWKLPAYGKASKNNFGSSSKGLQAAAMAACRDAMAFFSINFAREPVVKKWLAAGKPLLPPPPPPAPAENAETPADSPTTEQQTKADKV
jgi:hypothetical protein